MIGKLITSDADEKIIMEIYLKLMKENKNKVVSVEEIVHELLKMYPDSKIDDEIVFDVMYAGSHECLRHDKLFFNSQFILFNMDNSLGGGINCGIPRRDGKNDK